MCVYVCVCVSTYTYVDLYCACMHAKQLQSCPTIFDPMDHSLPGSSVRGVLWQEYWSGLPCTPPGDLLDLQFKPKSLASPALAGEFFTISTTWKALLAPYFF